MTGAIVISWGSPVRGREAKGLEVFSKALAYYEGLAKQGRIHGHHEYFAVTGNSGRVSGFMIIQGLLDELTKIQTEEATRKLTYEAQAIVENFAVQIYAGGSDRATQEQISSYVEVAQSLGLM